MAVSSQEQIREKDRITCPVWHSPILYVVPEGVLIKCKSCRREVHLVTKEELERLWDSMAKNERDIE